MQTTITTTEQPTIIWVPNQEVQREPQTNTNNQPAQKQKKKPKRQVQWTEDTVDNELLNRKKSNICCIYHKRHSENSDSEDTCSSDEEGNRYERDRITKQRHKQVCSKQKNHNCNHQHQH